ncbi:MAG: chloride channel protein [Candidatus Xenobia bacterium]
MNERGDFTASPRLLLICAISLVIGGICCVVAVVLLKLIYLCTNLMFYLQFSWKPIPPGDRVLGMWGILVPAVGGLIVGLMARYGSDRIRGHGIPEAMEIILFGKSRMEGKVAVLKPVSSAIAIGSGGPFGAEGPIIMTGGAFGSLIAQAFKVTAAERKTLLVAGAAGGMAAIFATPVAAVLLAVELLLFEWKPRSVVPVAIASIVAAALRPFFLGNGPLFPVPPHGDLGPVVTLAALGVGLVAGVMSSILTQMVYGVEDKFEKIPLHWMWWPAIGGLVVGIGGWFEPRAMGVGYDVIDDLLNGRIVMSLVLGLLIAKACIWAISLGSGTSGGVLAPLLICGGCAGALLSHMLPGPPTVWPLVCMAAVLGGTMRAPLTATVFALELTQDFRAALPILMGCIVSYCFTVLILKRSILTEKVARRGLHIACEYAVDPLECSFVNQVMSSPVETILPTLGMSTLIDRYFNNHHKHQGYPVVDEQGKLLGVVTRTNVLEHDGATDQAVSDLMETHVLTIPPDATCREAAEEMARHGVGRLMVVDPEKPDVLLGILTRSDLIKARQNRVMEENQREQFIDLRRRPHAQVK